MSTEHISVLFCLHASYRTTPLMRRNNEHGDLLMNVKNYESDGIKKMAKKYKAEDFIKALEDSDGIISVAARNLGCARSTFYKAIEEYKTVAEALEEVREATKDMVESAIMKQIRDGNSSMIMFFAKTRMKDRGYVEKQEVQQDGTLKIQVVYEDDFGSND